MLRDKFLIPIFLFPFLFVGCASNQSSVAAIGRAPKSELRQSSVLFEKMKIGDLPFEQRVGLFLENGEAPFKGCVVYLQGLGDSIQNHYPLFNKLTNSGFRILAFDYLGQGGSDGHMASTRVNSFGDPFPKQKSYEIGEQARFIWKRASVVNDPVFNRNCANSKKLILGWSTGALAAYKLAYEKWADGYVLIAPGIVPNFCVGESAKNCLANFQTDKVITERTLTTNQFEGGSNPHLDPVKPSSMLGIKEFAANLISTSFQSRHWKISSDQRGLVFLSGKEDTYVDREKTEKILKRNAPSFQIVKYEGALHEIDNEVAVIADDLHRRTIEFFDEVSGLP